MASPNETNARQVDNYPLGNAPPEIALLLRQAAMLNTLTRRFFEDIGLAPGMKVLDVGARPGDGALIAAEIVGPMGSVVRVDRSKAVLDGARSRAAPQTTSAP